VSSSEYEYLCVGICMADPDSGYCLGCGRPPIPVIGGGEIVVTLAPLSVDRSGLADPDSPEYSAEHP
jgi:hypothetical protein